MLALENTAYRKCPMVLNTPVFAVWTDQYGISSNPKVFLTLEPKVFDFKLVFATYETLCERGGD